MSAASLRTVNIGDIDSLLTAGAPPAAAMPSDPKAAAMVAELPLKQQKLALAQQELLLQRADSRRETAVQTMETQQRQQDRALKAQIEGAKLAHAQAKVAADQVLDQYSMRRVPQSSKPAVPTRRI